MLAVLPAAMYLSVAGGQSKIRPGEDPFPLKVGVIGVAPLLPGEMEGTLALIAIVVVQISLPSQSAVGAAMPFHGPIQLASVAWDSAGSVISPLLHAAAAAAVLLSVFVALWGRQLQP